MYNQEFSVNAHPSMHANKPTLVCLWLASMRNIAAEGLQATTAFFPIAGPCSAGEAASFTTFLAAAS